MKDLKRGFSFNSKGSLDMKMGLNSYNANDVINNLNQKEIELILKYFGEEKNYKKIAFQIVNKRKIKNLNTEDLVELIGKIRRKKFYSKINPSTKSFQALRIFVNNEISELIYGLINSVKNLKPGGILAVVTFHSLEDKIVKYFFKTYSEEKSNNSRYLPEIQNVNKKLFNLVQKKPILPSDKEISINPPSRSAKLRYVTRNENKFYFPQDLIDKFQNFIDIENIGLKL
jgi:16S rRNA (cytosine1402-N4)-methyltransferase